MDILRRLYNRIKVAFWLSKSEVIVGQRTDIANSQIVDLKILAAKADDQRPLRI